MVIIFKKYNQYREHGTDGTVGTNIVAVQLQYNDGEIEEPITNLVQIRPGSDRWLDENCPPNVESCDVCPKLCLCVMMCEIEKGD